MAQTIHMETETVLAIAKQLQETCEIIEARFQTLDINFQTMPWEGTSSEEFHASIHSLKLNFSKLNIEGKNLSNRAEQEVAEWLNADQYFAEGYSAVGKLAAVIASRPVGLYLTGMVMGASSSNGAANYNEMSWSERFDEQEAIQERISEAQNELDGLPQQREEAIQTIEEEIAYWEAKKAEMEELANNPFNKIPGNLKGDSASDIYEKEVQRCDEILASLNERKALYESEAYWGEKAGEIETRISDLKMQQTELNGLIQQGIESDGPTSGIKLAGCAKYVSEQRDVSDFMIPGDSNACQWDNNAIEAGYEVGDRPIPGSIMVIEPENGFMTVDSKAGHVVFIEKVTPVEGGYEITYSQASTPRDSAGNWTGDYSYTNVRTSTRVIADGTSGVSYIYEKPPI